MQEIWKDIVGYEELYQVSNLGRVKSLDRVIVRSHGERLTIHGRILMPLIIKGYCYVRLCDCGVWKNKQVHRLVAQAFIPNINGLEEINHKDENKQNNEANNLEWCTHKYNVNYGNRALKFSESMIGKLAGEKNPRYGKVGTFKGCKHSDAAKKRMSDDARGRIWINDGISAKRIRRNELQLFLDSGFRLGRL